MPEWPMYTTSSLTLERDLWTWKNRVKERLAVNAFDCLHIPTNDSQIKSQRLLCNCIPNVAVYF